MPTFWKRHAIISVALFLLVLWVLMGHRLTQIFAVLPLNLRPSVFICVLFIISDRLPVI